MSVSIAVDAMSGDRGPAVAATAIKTVLAANPDLQVIAVGDEKVLQPLLGEQQRAAIAHAPGVVTMTDDPLKALRRKDTSMFKAIELVHKQEAAAALSCGNTGALMGMARIQLHMLKGFSRPAIASFVPCKFCTDRFCMLDFGANVERTAQLLVSHAYLGDALMRAVTDKANPTVGLLNIGAEIFKGDEQLKEASATLQDSPLNFIGNIEPNRLYDGVADVVVCDGFTGNVVLKSMEGLSTMIKGMIGDAFKSSAFAQLGGLMAMPVLNGLKRTMDARRYNGAAFLGLRGLVVKSHGGADEVAFEAALDFTVRQARRDLISLIHPRS